MKENWEYKRLGEVCCSKSAIERATKIFESNSEILYIDITSIDNQTNCISSYTRTLMSKAPSRAQQCVKKKDVLVSLVRPNLKNVAMLDEDENNFVASSGFCILRSGEKILPKFIFKFVCSETFTDYLVGLTAGANYPAVREDDVRNALIPIPPLDEQEQIVAELDLLSDVIDKQKAELKELDNLAQSTFYDMFGDPIENPKGWDVQPLKNLTTKIGSGATPKGGKESYKLEGIPLIRSLNVYNGMFKYKDLAYIDTEQASALDNVILQHGDVLLNITGASVARCCIVPSELVSGRVNQHVAILRPRESLKYVFLCAQLISSGFQHKLLHDSKANGATREALTKPQLESMPIIVPPLSLQQEFADKIASIEKQKTALTQSIAESQKLLDYTMDKYFG